MMTGMPVLVKLLTGKSESPESRLVIMVKMAGIVVDVELRDGGRRWLREMGFGNFGLGRTCMTGWTQESWKSGWEEMP